MTKEENKAKWERMKTVFKRDGKKYICLNCGKEAPSQRKYCSECVGTGKDVNRGIANIRTLKEVIKENGNPKNRYASIRALARKIAEENFKKECYNCGYDKHVECCHKKGISTFPENTLVKEINDTNNLVFLCPNCHWEFDKGLLITP